MKNEELAMFVLFAISLRGLLFLVWKLPPKAEIVPWNYGGSPAIWSF